MQTPEDIYSYMQLHVTELGQQILSSYPALHNAAKLRLRCSPYTARPSLLRICQL